MIKAFFNSLLLRFTQWQYYRYQRMIAKRRRHWQCSAIGGSTMQLGFMTRREALHEVTLLKSGPVIFIDDEHAVIMYGHSPQAAPEQ